MPYNIWCGGCQSMIAKGVRFNAEKKQVGNYYSTKVQFPLFVFALYMQLPFFSIWWLITWNNGVV
jgi:hypothetical protein